MTLLVQDNYSWNCSSSNFLHSYSLIRVSRDLQSAEYEILAISTHLKLQIYQSVFIISVKLTREHAPVLGSWPAHGHLEINKTLCLGSTKSNSTANACQIANLLLWQKANTFIFSKLKFINPVAYQHYNSYFHLFSLKWNIPDFNCQV